MVCKSKQRCLAVKRRRNKRKICGKAQYLGKFEDWRSAAQALLDVYNDESEKKQNIIFTQQV